MRTMDEVLAAARSGAAIEATTVIRPTRGGRPSGSVDSGLEAKPAGLSRPGQQSATVIARGEKQANSHEPPPEAAGQSTGRKESEDIVPGLSGLMDAGRSMRPRSLRQALFFAGAALLVVIVGAIMIVAQQAS
jgi:hypothetical protein